MCPMEKIQLSVCLKVTRGDLLSVSIHTSITHTYNPECKISPDRNGGVIVDLQVGCTAEI